MAKFSSKYLALSFLVAGTQLLCSTAQSPGDILSSTASVAFLNAPDDSNLRLTWDTELRVVGGQRVLYVAARVKGGVGTLPMIDGITISMVSPKLFCGNEGAGTNCLPSPESATYPENKWYLEQASRKWMYSMTNSNNLRVVDPCQSRVVPEYCTTKAECDRLGWTSETSMLNAYASTLADPSKNILKTPTLISINKRRDTATGGFVFTYALQWELPDDMFVLSSDTDDTWTLGLNSGDWKYIAFAIHTNEQVVNRDLCSDSLHNSIFSRAPAYRTQVPWTSARNDDVHVRFVEIFQPTQFPTQSPTPSPTQFPTKFPTKAPTFSPTERPTLPPVPTRSPTLFPTARPTTARPTKSPTTPEPTKSPTDRPTMRPTTARPTKQPTTGRPSAAPTSRPTAAPVGLFCPKERHWELCTRINTWWKHLRDDPEARRKNIARACRNNGCTWCGYEGNSAMSCRPRVAKENRYYRTYEYDFVCPPDQSDPFMDSPKCDQFSECPTPEEMTACRKINSLPYPEYPKYKKFICESEFEMEVNGQMVTIGEKRCAYNNGLCRAVGRYAWATKTIANIPGFFDKIKGCPSAE